MLNFCNVLRWDFFFKFFFKFVWFANLSKRVALLLRNVCASTTKELCHEFCLLSRLLFRFSTLLRDLLLNVISIRLLDVWCFRMRFAFVWNVFDSSSISLRLLFLKKIWLFKYILYNLFRQFSFVCVTTTRRFVLVVNLFNFSWCVIIIFEFSNFFFIFQLIFIAIDVTSFFKSLSFEYTFCVDDASSKSCCIIDIFFVFRYECF